MEIRPGGILPPKTRPGLDRRHLLWVKSQQVLGHLAYILFVYTSKHALYEVTCWLRNEKFSSLMKPVLSAASSNAVHSLSLVPPVCCLSL